MDLTLGKRADYSVRAVLDLARHHGDGRRTAREIAEEMEIPAAYLPQLMTALVAAGLVDSEVGRNGGYRLVPAPAEVDLLAVIEAAEGPVGSQECVLRGGPCRWEDHCAVHEPWWEAQEALRTRLRTTTFARLLTLDDELAGAGEGSGTGG